MKRALKAETYLGILVAISLFALFYLAATQWQSQQNYQRNLLFQQQQALQIAENQLALKMAGVETCEVSVNQNNLTFVMQCENSIQVRFPLGEITLVKP